MSHRWHTVVLASELNKINENNFNNLLSIPHVDTEVFRSPTHTLNAALSTASIKVSSHITLTFRLPNPSSHLSRNATRTCSVAEDLDDVQVPSSTASLQRLCIISILGFPSTPDLAPPVCESYRCPMVEIRMHANPNPWGVHAFPFPLPPLTGWLITTRTFDANGDTAGGS